MFIGSEKTLRDFFRSPEFRDILSDRIFDVLLRRDVTVALGDRIDGLFNSSVILQKVFLAIDKALEIQGKTHIKELLAQIFNDSEIEADLIQMIVRFVDEVVQERGTAAIDNHIKSPQSQNFISDEIKKVIIDEFHKDAVIKNVKSRIESVIEDETRISLAGVVATHLSSDALTDNINKKIKEIIDENLSLKIPVLVKYERMDGTISPPMLTHQKFEDVIKAVSVPGGNVLMVGPAGSGKTQIAQDISKALGIPFYFNGPVQSEYKLLGFRDATGVYSPTPFYNAYSSGGVYLFDEIDASSPQALVAFNTAIANRLCDFPGSGEPVRAVDGFHCLAAANTFGRGANHDYVGRNQLDAATLDRFIVIEIDYDPGMEFRLARNDSWVKKVQKWRERARTLGVRHVISMRASIIGAQLLKKFPEPIVEDMVVWRGLDLNTVAKIKAI